MHRLPTSLLLESQRARSTIMLDKLMLLRCPSVDMAVPYLLVADMVVEHHHRPDEIGGDR